MNTFEQKQESRKERYQELANKFKQKAYEYSEQSRKMASIIPFGQPILIGHHSENKDRRYREKIGRFMNKSIDMQEKAKYYENKAQAVAANGAISSDDPQALGKLEQKLLKAQEDHKSMLAANKMFRKVKDPKDRIKSMIDLGFTENEAVNHIDFSIKHGEHYLLFNLPNSNANIKRLKERIETIKNKQTLEDKEIIGKNYTLRQDTKENRLMFFFPDKPSQEVMKALKQNGFKWSPSRSAWVRQWTNAAVYSATLVRRIIEKDAEV